jgi:peptide/nickel transport system substrate-binding protein
MKFSPRLNATLSALIAALALLLVLSCTQDGQFNNTTPITTATSLPTFSAPATSTVEASAPTPSTPAEPTATERPIAVTQIPIASPSPAPLPTQPVDEDRRGGTLNLASRQAITHYDIHSDISPALSTWGPGVAYSRLMKFQAGPEISLPSLQVQCDLCSEWSMVDDVTFEFELRQDAKWQNIDPVDGRGVTASDVVFSYLSQQQSQSPNAALLHMLESVEAVDEKTLRLNLKAPDADFMVALADGHSKIIAPEALSITGDLASGSTIGSGPWILTESRPGVRHFFQANPDYYEQGYPLLDRLNIHVLEDVGTRDAAFQVRNIDVHQMSPIQWQKHVGRVPDAPVLFSPDQGTGLEVALNAGSEPFRDARLRRAALFSMEPWAAVEEAWLGLATVGQGLPAPSADWLLPKVELRSYFGDPEQALELVSEVGNTEPIHIVIKVGDFGEAYIDHSARIADEMRAVGFDPEIVVVNRRYFGENVWLGGDYQMFVGPTAPVLAPNAYLLSVLHSEGQWNTTGVYNTGLDGLIESQAQEFDPDKRKELFLEVQRRAMADSHRFMAAGGMSVWTWWPRVQSFHPNFAGFEYDHWSRVSVR